MHCVLKIKQSLLKEPFCFVEVTRKLSRDHEKTAFVKSRKLSRENKREKMITLPIHLELQYQTLLTEINNSNKKNLIKLVFYFIFYCLVF